MMDRMIRFDRTDEDRILTISRALEERHGRKITLGEVLTVALETTAKAAARELEKNKQSEGEP